MRIVMLGPPGSGKGTQGVVLAGKLGIPAISTGEILRGAIRAGSPLGLRVQSIVQRGELVQDSLVLELVEERTARPDCAKGFLLDGYPRNLGQAADLEKALQARGLRLDQVLFLDVPEEDVVRRLSGRLTCSGCQALYHVETSQPARAGVCDKCGGRLERRKDDQEEVIRDRMRVYRKETEPLLRFYEERGTLRRVDGVGAIERIQERLWNATGGKKA